MPGYPRLGVLCVCLISIAVANCSKDSQPTMKDAGSTAGTDAGHAAVTDGREASVPGLSDALQAAPDASRDSPASEDGTAGAGQDAAAQDVVGQDNRAADAAIGAGPDSGNRDQATRDSRPGLDSNLASGPEAGSVDVPLGEPSAWQSRGIGGGGALFTPEISPSDDQVYMATDMGAVFHTEDFGGSWRTLDFRVLTGGNHAQVRFTSSPTVLYAIAPDANEVQVPFISKNGGSSFTRIGDGSVSELFYLEVDPARSDRLLVADYSAIYFSNDSGATFRPVYLAAHPSGAGMILAGAHWDDANIYVGTNDGLLVSTDGGSTFALRSVDGMRAGQSIVSFAGAKQGQTTRFFAVTASEVWGGQTGCETSGEGLYQLDLGQTTWTDLTDKLPSGHRPTFVRMAANNTSVAYVAGADPDTSAPVVAKTSDGGGTWTDVFRTDGNANIATGWSGEGGDRGWGYGECTEGFAVSRSDPAKAVITDLGFVHVTNDGGKTWQQAYVDPSDQNPAGASTPPGRAYRGIGAEDTSVWWLTWPDATTIFASFTDITSLRSTDSGVHWVNDYSRNGLTLNTTYQAVLAPSGTMYAPTSPIHDAYMSYVLTDSSLDKSSGAIMMSTDKGARWTRLHDFGHPVIFVALDPNNAETMYASVIHHTEGGVFKTANLGQGASSTWTKLANPPRTEGHPYNLVVLNDGSVVATFSGRRTPSFTESAGVFILPPGGSSWTDVSAPGMRYWVKDLLVDPNDKTQSTWYVGVFLAWGTSAAADSNGLYRTTDRGQSWQRIWAGHNVESMAIDPRNPAKMFVTTEMEGLWTTTNLTASSPTFTADPDYPFLHPLRVFFNPYVPGEVWIASFGGGMRVRQF